jgi:hypothetical protein
MRKGLFLLLLAACAFAADNQLTPAEEGAGWRLLFDGKTFTGWEDPGRKSPPGDSFVIEDGCLKATARPRMSEDLYTSDTYEDFELEFDWKISRAGNAGVKYRIQKRVMLLDQGPRRFEDQVILAIQNPRSDRPVRGAEYVIGFEYQITDNAENSDARRGPLYQTAAMYGMFPALKDVTRPRGEFNHSRVVVRGDRVEHWLNGEKVLEASLKAPEIAASVAGRWGEGSPVYDLLVRQPVKACQIALQNHGDEAWFKNIKIRKL